MDNTIWIVLIVTAAVVAVLIIFRRQLSRFFFKAGREGLETELTTHPPGKEEGAAAGAPAAPPRPSVLVRGNVQEGIGNAIDVQRGDAEVVENLQEGIDQQLRVGPDQS